MYDFSFQFHAKAYFSNIKSSYYSKYSKTAKRLKEKFINDEKNFVTLIGLNTSYYELNCSLI